MKVKTTIKLPLGRLGSYSLFRPTNLGQYAPGEKKWYLLKKEMHEAALDYHYGDTINNDAPKITVASDSTRIETEKNFGKIYFEDYDIYQRETK